VERARFRNRGRAEHSRRARLYVIILFNIAVPARGEALRATHDQRFMSADPERIRILCIDDHRTKLTGRE
jgi:hypothetical protein